MKTHQEALDSIDAHKNINGVVDGVLRTSRTIGPGQYVHGFNIFGSFEAVTTAADTLGGTVSHSAKDYMVVLDTQSIEIVIEMAEVVLVKRDAAKRKEYIADDGVLIVPEDPALRTPPSVTDDPNYNLPFSKRKQMAKANTGPSPEISLYFHLAGDKAYTPTLFKIDIRSWDIYNDLNRESVRDRLKNDTKATLDLELVQRPTHSFYVTKLRLSDPE